MTEKKPKRPRDPNQLAKLMVDIATGHVSDIDPDDIKDPAAVARGRAGGLKGGRARAESLSSEDRSQVARMAAQARWGRK